MNNSKHISNPTATPILKIGLLFVLLLILIAVSACTTEATNNDNAIPVVNTISNSTNPNWITNNTTRSANMTNGNGVGILEDVQKVQVVEIDSITYELMTSTGIPKYDFSIRQKDLDQITSRPDYSNGGFRDQNKFTSITVGDTVRFGQDLGYNNANNDGNCVGGNGQSGNGYWPPGPGCPTDQSHSNFFRTTPVAQTGTLFETGLGTMGSFINGVSVFDWQDGTAYDTAKVWEYTAAAREVHDLDICEGHAANGNYHHHFYSPCLASIIGDTGTGHSPVYGYAADGYPIHGPWHANGVLVISSWRKRVYSTNTTYPDFGCGTVGKRTCTIQDPYNGADSSILNTTSSGPDTNATITTQSKHDITAVSGTFFADHYYDKNMHTKGTRSLDVHGGHQHGSLSYHYHLPLEDANSETPVFPYTIGPRLKGVVNATHWSKTGGTSQPPGPQRSALKEHDHSDHSH